MVQDLESEMVNAKTIFENLLGEKSIKEEKNVFGRVVAALGWEINLEHMIVTVADKNINKAGFCLI